MMGSAPVMRIKAFLASLLAIIVHLAMPMMLGATSAVTADGVSVEAPCHDEDGACLPRASTAADLYRPTIADDASESSPRRPSRRQPVAALAVPPRRRQLVPHRSNYPVRRTRAHRRMLSDDDQPA